MIIYIVKYFFCIFLIALPIDSIAGKLSENFGSRHYVKSAVCGNCHVKIYEAWKRSLHAYSTMDPIFQTAILNSLKIKPMKEIVKCFSCHAPVARKMKEIDFSSEDVLEGVTCDFCHSSSGIIKKGKNSILKSSPGLTKYGPFGHLNSPVHKTKKNDIFRKSEFCMTCHEYWRKNAGLLTTYSEWREGKYSKQNIQCQNCHMPYIEGEIVSIPGRKTSIKKINLHEPPGGRSIKQLKKAAKVEIISKVKEGQQWRVKVQVINSGAGHKLPTGIPSRYLLLEFIAETKGGGKRIFTDNYKFMKLVGDKKGNPLYKDYEIMTKGERIIKDNRLAPGEKRVITFSFISNQKDLVAKARLLYIYEPYIIEQEMMRVEIDKVSEELR